MGMVFLLNYLVPQRHKQLPQVVDKLILLGRRQIAVAEVGRKALVVERGWEVGAIKKGSHDERCVKEVLVDGVGHTAGEEDLGADTGENDAELGFHGLALGKGGGGGTDGSTGSSAGDGTGRRFDEASALDAASRASAEIPPDAAAPAPAASHGRGDWKRGRPSPIRA